MTTTYTLNKKIHLRLNILSVLLLFAPRDGLAACHPLLVPYGLLAVTELCWLENDPPEECQRFFVDGYPAMANVESALEVVEACKYEVLDHFVLPESAWWDQYYLPLEDRLRAFRERYAPDQAKIEFIESVQTEIDIYRKGL